MQDLCHATRYIRTSSNPTGGILIKFFHNKIFGIVFFSCAFLLFFVCCLFLFRFDFFCVFFFFFFLLFFFIVFLGCVVFVDVFFYFKFQSQSTK